LKIVKKTKKQKKQKNKKIYFAIIEEILMARITWMSIPHVTTKKNPLYLNALLVVILVVKIMLLSVIIIDVYQKHRKNTDKIYKYDELKDILHHIFTFLMGILLIILFNPQETVNNKCINRETRIFLFIFGTLSIISVAKYFYDKYLMLQ